MRLYLIRHGETELNKEFRFIGRTDDPLSAKGLAQAKEAADYLSNADIKAVYSSDLKRATQTAEIIAKPHGLKIKISSDLREIDFGDWEALAYDEIDKLYHGTLKDWLEDPVNTQIPGGEPWDRFRERILSAIREIAGKEKDGNVAVVMHGGPIKLLMSFYNSGDPVFFKKYWPAPGSVSVINI